MQNSRPMCRRQCLGNLDRKIQCLLKRHRTFPQPVGQRFAVELLHDEKYRTVLRANVVEMADVRMIQRRDSPRLSLKARIQFGVRRKVRRQNLDCDRAVEPRVARPIHLSHAACTERRLDFVGPQFAARREWHSRGTLYPAMTKTICPQSHLSWCCHSEEAKSRRLRRRSG